MISIAGGKLTTYRKMAERIVAMVSERLIQLGVVLPESKGESEQEPLSGGDTGDDVDAFTARLKQRWWNAADQRLITPRAFGWGYALNFARLFRRSA